MVPMSTPVAASASAAHPSPADRGSGGRPFLRATHVPTHSEMGNSSTHTSGGTIHGASVEMAHVRAVGVPAQSEMGMSKGLAIACRCETTRR